MIGPHIRERKNKFKQKEEQVGRIRDRKISMQFKENILFCRKVNSQRLVQE